jgi:hypothetical protein
MESVVGGLSFGELLLLKKFNDERMWADYQADFAGRGDACNREEFFQILDEVAAEDAAKVKRQAKLARRATRARGGTA